MACKQACGFLTMKIVTFKYMIIMCSRRHRIRALPGQLGYRLMAGGEEGMSPAELRALPVVIHEKHVRSRHQNGALICVGHLSPLAGRCWQAWLSICCHRRGWGGV